MASEEIEDGALHGDECGFKIREDAVGGVLRHYVDFGHIPAENVFVVLHSSSDAVDAARVGELMSSWGDVRDA